MSDDPGLGGANFLYSSPRSEQSSRNYKTKTQPGRNASNVVNPYLEREIEEAFSLFDTNEDGLISFFECQAAFRALRLASDYDSVIELFKEFGKSADDHLTLSDFKLIASGKIYTRYTQDEVDRIFNLLQDGHGLITIESLANAASRIGTLLNREELEIMITEASKNGIGVTLEEFRPLLWQSWSGFDVDGLSDEYTSTGLC